MSNIDTMSAPIVEAQDLSIAFGGEDIWSGANFSIYPGELIAVLGPNGAGKSTLLKMLLGLQAPTGGSLNVLGKVPKKGNPEIGYVPQSRAWDSEVTISGSEIVGFGVDGSRWGVELNPKKIVEKEYRVKKAIHSVDATHFAERRIGELSGGERQRLLLAQALVSNPKLLLLDEPLASLDLRNQILIAELVAKLAKERNLGVLLVTHDLNPLFSLVDRVLYVTHYGVEIGRPEEIITVEVLSRLYATPVEVLEDKKGRRFVVGIEDVTAHPHGPNKKNHV